jgi:hypothetical protein
MCKSKKKNISRIRNRKNHISNKKNEEESFIESIKRQDKIFYWKEINNVKNFFNDMIDLDGKEITVKFRIKNKKNGDFNGVEYDPKYILRNKEKIDITNFKSEIISDISLTSKLSEDYIVFKFSELIDEKYNEKLGIYIFNMIDNHKYKFDIYDYPGNMSIQDKYLNPYDKSIIRFDNNMKLVDRNKNTLSFYDIKLKSFYNIHDIEINTSSSKFDFKKLLIKVGKININIYDHFGDLHQYTEYHKLADESLKF